MFFKKNNTPQMDGKGAVLAKKVAPSIISSDVNLMGSIISDGFVDIDGKIEGNVKAFSVTVRANGRIKGDVIAETVQIFGEVKGLVKAKNVYLYASCRVVGIIMHEALTIEDGAFVDGKFKRTDKNLASGEDFAFEEDEMQPGENVNVLEHLRLIS